ncbi:2'-5' RNA ligase family protein [Amycolatopsis sp. cmx-8-4]|uniref:2'-5' RNA ligase family protein n=1 Tax=Amycolatopsis sp. cmx-8-4 TaxID=2790947 RepID=UPI003977F147
MNPTFASHPDWPAGHRQLQLIVIPDLDANSGLAGLITACRDVMRRHPAPTEPVPDASLHLTVQTIHPPGTGHVDRPTRHRLIGALEHELSTTPAFCLLVGSLLAYHGGVLADTHNDAGFNHLLDRVRPVIARIAGPEAISYDSRPAHLTLRYAAPGNAASGDALQRVLRRAVRPGHASLTVDAVHLVDTERNPTAGRYDSTVLQRFPLAQEPQ